MNNEIFLKTSVSSSKDFKPFSPPNAKEALPRILIPKSSDAAVRRSLPILIKVSSPHLDADSR